ncbi:MAG: hypothetical protein ACOYL3_07600 [Desulfuromonadaceae bacterium]
MNKMSLAGVFMIMTMITGCGGGGSSTPSPITPITPTTAVLKFSSQGTLPDGKAVAGVRATVELPAGVSVKTTGTGDVDTTVVVPSGLFDKQDNLLPVTYTAATANAKATLSFSIVSLKPAGAGVGEYATLTLNLSGVSPVVSDYRITLFNPRDMSGGDITALTPALAL